MATLSTETNTFSNIPTSRQNFVDYYYREGTATLDPPNLMTQALNVWRARAEELGWAIGESLSAIAEPSGPMESQVYLDFKGQILDDLRKCPTPDVILLQLHGAMISKTIHDCEGDLLNAIRAMCPDSVIGVSLDLHCHLTKLMMDASDLINCFKEYPHDDAAVRAHELFDVAKRTASGEIRPVMRDFDCRMIGFYLTKQGPMRAFVNRLSQVENEPGVLSVSLVHGFPFAGIPDVGTRMLAISDNDAPRAETYAQELGQAFFDIRDAVTSRYISLANALDTAMTPALSPIVLADMSDNPGAGAPGDATYVLQALLDR